MANKQIKKGKSKTKGETNRGADSKLTDETRVKVKEVAALDGTIEEMAYYCGVSRQTIYNWFEAEPELFDEVERLRQRPVLKARQTVTKNIGESYANAMDYLSRKRKGEFSQRQENTGADGSPLIPFDNEQIERIFRRRNKSSSSGSKRKSN